MEASRKQALLVFSIGCSIAGLGWAGIYIITGHYESAVFPAVFSLVLGMALIVYRVFHTFKLLLYSQLVMILLIPTVLQWSLGGFAASGFVILWGLSAPVGALILTRFRHSVLWILAFLSAVALSVAFDHTFYARANELHPVGENTRLFFAAMNLTGMTLVMTLALTFFSRTLMLETRQRENLIHTLEEAKNVISNALSGLSNGNLIQINRGETETIQSGESMSRLFDSYDNSIRLLSELVRRIQESTAMVSGAMKKESETIGRLMTSIENESAGISSTEELLKSIKKENQQIFEALDEGSQMIETNSDSVRAGKAASQTMMQIWKDFAAAIESTTKNINELRSGTSQITDILNVIRDIAEKTSLLSLNASIEAARAGEAGKGFAVVAREIGLLADLANQSAGQIDHEIETIVQNIGKATSSHGRLKDLMQSGEKSSGQVELLTNRFGDQYTVLQGIYSNMKNRSEKQLNYIAEVGSRTSGLIRALKEFEQMGTELNTNHLELKQSIHSIESSAAHFSVL